MNTENNDTVRDYAPEIRSLLIALTANGFLPIGLEHASERIVLGGIDHAVNLIGLYDASRLYVRSNEGNGNVHAIDLEIGKLPGELIVDVPERAGTLREILDNQTELWSNRAQPMKDSGVSTAMKKLFPDAGVDIPVPPVHKETLGEKLDGVLHRIAEDVREELSDVDRASGAAAREAQAKFNE